jgi:predicted ArsR family transcriptional regulator
MIEQAKFQMQSSKILLGRGRTVQPRHGTGKIVSGTAATKKQQAIRVHRCPFASLRPEFEAACNCRLTLVVEN